MHPALKDVRFPADTNWTNHRFKNLSEVGFWWVYVASCVNYLIFTFCPLQVISRYWEYVYGGWLIWVGFLSSSNAGPVENQGSLLHAFTRADLE